MNNFVMRTLSGILFVTLIVGSILLNYFTFAAVFALISGLAVLEFHKLTNSSAVSVNLGVGLFGALLLFLSSFLHASEILSGPGGSLRPFRPF